MTSTTAERDERPPGGGRERELQGGEKRLLALLGLPTFALALSISTVTTYLPVVARSFSGSNLVIGLIVAIEGLMALWVPIAGGSWSDRLKTAWGGRLPFLAAGAPLAALALLLMGVSRSMGLLALLAAVFFFAYFLAYEPYRALYPDAVDDEVAGRAQSTQAIWRGVGTGLALLGGGLLIGLAKAAPFVLAAVVLVGSVTTFVAVMRKRIEPRRSGDGDSSVMGEARHLLALLREHPQLRTFLLANGLFELSLGALKTFVFLYLSQGLGLKSFQAALAIGAGALFVLGGATASGKLGDRLGRLRVLQWALPVYGLGLIVPFLVTAKLGVAAVVPFVALGGGTIMALPYAVLQPLMPKDDHGALTGFFTFSRGVGTSLGPLLAGVAITATDSVFTSTQGYQAMWGVCAAAVLVSIPVVGRLRPQERERCGES